MALGNVQLPQPMTGWGESYLLRPRGQETIGAGGLKGGIAAAAEALERYFQLKSSRDMQNEEREKLQKQGFMERLSTLKDPTEIAEAAKSGVQMFPQDAEFFQSKLKGLEPRLMQPLISKMASAKTPQDIPPDLAPLINEARSPLQGTPFAKPDIPSTPMEPTTRFGAQMDRENVPPELNALMNTAALSRGQMTQQADLAEKQKLREILDAERGKKQLEEEFKQKNFPEELQRRRQIKQTEEEVGEPFKIREEGRKQLFQDDERRKHEAFELQMHKLSQGDARLDKSFKLSTDALNRYRTPLDAQSQQLEKLAISYNQNNPQADSLIAPELLTAMAGGRGSGLRMNEAEISRIVGARGIWEGLKADLQRWQLNPSKPFAFRPEQRSEIGKLIKAAGDQNQMRQGILNDAERQIISAGDVNTQRTLINKVHQAMGQFETPNPTLVNPTGAPPSYNDALSRAKAAAGIK